MMTNKWTDNSSRNLFLLFSQDEEAERIRLAEERSKEEEKEYDPRNYEILYRGKGNREVDYTILFAAQAKLDMKTKSALEWYKNLCYDPKLIELGGIDW